MKIACQIMPNDEKAPNGYQYVNCRMVFRIEMEDFHRKSHLAVGGNATQMLDFITYSHMIMRETVCIDLTVEELRDLEVKATDVLRTYLMAPEKRCRQY